MTPHWARRAKVKLDLTQVARERIADAAARLALPRDVVADALIRLVPPESLDREVLRVVSEDLRARE